MKSSQQDKPRHLQTSCKTCLFATYKGGTQTGCKAGRIKKYRDQGLVLEAYDNDREFYVINTLCNQLRTPEWNGGEVDVDKAYNEVAPTHTIIIFTDSITARSKNSAVAYLKNIDYDRSKIRIVISQKISAPKKEKTLVTQLYTQVKEIGFAYLVTKVSIDSKFRDFDLFRVSKTSFCTRVDMSQKVPKNFFKAIHKKLNKEATKGVIFEKMGIKAISHPLVMGGFSGFEDYSIFESAVSKQAVEQNFYINL